MAAGSIPSLKQLDSLSKEICDCWQSLGIQLDVEVTRIDCIRDDHVQFPSLERKAFAMLKSWYDKGSGSTYYVLSEGLKNVGKARLAEKYCEARSRTLPVCRVHDDAVLEYFCVECQQSICRKCTTTTHKDHDSENLEEAKIRLKEIENRLKDETDVWKIRTDKDKSTRRQMKKQIEETRQAIQENTRRLMELLKRHEQQLLTEVDEFEEDVDQTFKHQTEKSELLREQLTSITEYLRRARLRATNEEVLKAEQTTMSRSHELFDSLANFQPLVIGYVKYKPDEDVSRRLDNSPLGRVFSGLVDPQKTQIQGLEKQGNEKERRTHQDTIVTKDPGDDACYSASQHVSVKIPTKSPAKRPLDAHVTKRRPLEYKAVTTFGSRGSDSGQFVYPCGIAVNRADEVAVSDSNNHRVQVFSADGQYLREFGTKGTADGQFRRPAGLSYNKAGHIVVADQLNFRIQVFSSTGRWISKFGQDVLQQPSGVSITSDDNIVVCDDGSKTVNVFSSDGVRLLQFSQGPSPRSAIFCDKKCFVSLDSHVIKVFDSRGSHLYEISQQGNGAGRFNYPRGLAVNTDHLLLVCDRNKHRVQVVTLDGEFVTSFGSRGAGLGQFICPIYIAVSLDGRVFVTDRDNHRVQVFQAQY